MNRRSFLRGALACAGAGAVAAAVGIPAQALALPTFPPKPVWFPLYSGPIEAFRDIVSRRMGPDVDPRSFPWRCYASEPLLEGSTTGVYLFEVNGHFEWVAMDQNLELRSPYMVRQVGHIHNRGEVRLLPPRCEVRLLPQDASEANAWLEKKS